LAALALACSAASAAVLPAAAAEKLVYASYVSEVYTISKTDIWMMQEVEKRTQGRIKFETYFSGALLKAPDLYPGLQSGAADVVMGVPSAYNRNDYRLSNFVLPYISSKADAVAKALGEVFAGNADLRKEYEGRGAKVLYVVPWSENTFWSQKPVTKVDDFKGLKVRSLQAIADSMKKLGATPVAMAWPEALESLTRGVVDVVSSAPFDSAVLGGLHEVARYGSDAGDMGIFSIAVTSVSLQRWNALPAADRKIIEEVAAEAPAHYLAGLDEELNKAVDKLCAYKGNLQINLFSEAEAQKVKATAAAPVHADWAAWAKEANKSADTDAILKRYVELVRKYEPDSKWLGGFQRYVAKGCGKS